MKKNAAEQPGVHAQGRRLTALKLCDRNSSERQDRRPGAAVTTRRRRPSKPIPADQRHARRSDRRSS